MNRKQRDSEALVGVEPELASAINLMAHPMAGFAAAGALGFGLASQAFGLWLGTLAGAAEASRRMLDPEPVAALPVKREKLRLVVSKPAAAVAKAAAKGVADGRPAGIARPARPDDLKAISGIGPKLEKVLNGFGLWTYRQVAALSAAEIDWLDGKLGFAGRIGRDDWVGQAGALLRRA